MTFEEKLAFIKSAVDTISIADADIKHLLSSIQDVFEDQNFQNELNDKLYDTSEETNYDFLKVFIEKLVSYLETNLANGKTHVQTLLQILDRISKLRIKQFIVLDAGVFKQILEILRVNLHSASSYTTITLEIVLNLSESRFYDKLHLDDTSLKEINDLLNEFASKASNTQLKMVKLVQANLNERSVERRLKNFKIYLTNLDGLLSNETYFEDLRFLSKELNNNNQYFETRLFFKHDSFTILAQLLEHYFDVIHQKSEEKDADLEDECDQMRDLFEIIFKLVQRSMTITEAFLALGMCKPFLKLFDHHAAIYFLFDRNKINLQKITRIFYNLSKQIYYSENSEKYINATADVDILRRTFDLFDSLNNFKEEKCDDNILLRIHLISLSYLQVKLLPNVTLLRANYFECAKKSAIQTVFVRTTDEHFKNAELINWEFRNEFNKLERCKVTKLDLSGINRHNDLLPYVTVDVLNNIKFICFNEQNKIIGFEKYKHFFLSVLYFGLDIEKLVCLNALKDFLAVEQVRNEIFSNQELILFLSDLRDRIGQKLDDSVNYRLCLSIYTFLSQMYISHTAET